MNLSRLVFQNIRHYARSWLITLTGVIIGTAVLTGSLITGNSVRNSLSGLVSLRLGETRFALAPGDRFFRQALAGELATASGFPVVSLLRTRGIITIPANNLTLNRVEIVGVNRDFFKFWKQDKGKPGFVQPLEDEAVISSNVAGRLQVKPGDVLVVKLSKEGFAPANAPFVSKRSEPSGIRLKIKAIAEDHTGGRFSLDNSQSAPFNIFVSQEFLALKMGMPGFANTLLIATNGHQVGAETMNKLLRNIWRWEDAGLMESVLLPRLSQLVSRRIFIEDTLAQAIRKSLSKADGIITYLVNDISLRKRSTPYSFITAAAPAIAPADPEPGEIVINNWLARDLAAKPGDSITIRYWIMGPLRSLSQVSKQFKVQSVVPVRNSETDRALMPDFPGIKNTGNCRDWETGTPVDLSRIRDKDEEYWNLYRGTPKAWISLADGQKIWRNPFGSYTAFRFSERTTARKLTNGLRELEPSAIGLIFSPVFEEGMHAAGNSTDFGQLFLSLSMLIEIAGLMLSGMLLSFFLRQRIEEMILMRAIGFRIRNIIFVFLSETLLVSAAGGILGVLAAIFYARLVVAGLNTLWVNAVNTSSLTVSINGITLVTGFLAGVIINVIVFSFILFRNSHRSLPSPYRRPEPGIPERSGFGKLFGILLVVAPFGSAILIILSETLSRRFYPSTSFLISGLLILAGIIVCIALFLSRKNRPELNVRATLSLYVLKNTILQKVPAITAITLLALGTFTILVTGLNRRSGGHHEDQPGSGTGGFRLWMESTIPLFEDLNTVQGRMNAGMEENLVLKNIRFVSIPGVTGDDASCLNLNQVAKPGLLGVPACLFDLKRSFSFANLGPGIDPAHPWSALEQVDNTGCIKGFADQTVITWGLRKQIGDTLLYTDESGRRLKIKLAGALENSVFQGSLLISDSVLHLYFPSSSRIRITLIDSPPELSDTLIRILEERLADLGTVVIPAKERLATFNLVENTYLDLFIMLGGFGLIIGTAGLAVMILRNLRDRQHELALYSALGFPFKMTYQLLAGEFLFILAAGIFTGIVAALAGSLPSLISGGWGALYSSSILLCIVLLNGLIWIHFPIRGTLLSLRGYAKETPSGLSGGNNPVLH
ncbi:MAG: ABC transporter permease [Bacteroidetes bacterium]|nr:ABC transporter permease [Bacteroidota bacterium]